jgi:hypothetical protein
MKKKRRFSTIGKKLLACVCSVAMMSALIPAVALADDSTTTDDAYITVVTKNEMTGKEVTLKEFSKADIENLAEQNTTPQSFTFAGKSTQVVKTQTYVTFSQLFDAAGVTTDVWNENSTVTTSDAGGTDPSVKGASPVTYQMVTQKQYFYPNSTNVGPTDKTKAVEVSACIGLDELSGTLSDGTTAGNVAEKLTDFSDTESVTAKAPRVYYGLSSDATEYLKGMYFWNGISKITINYTPEKTATTATKSTTGIATGKTATAGKGASKATYKVTSNKKSTATYVKCKASKKSVTVPSTVKINGKTYKVTAVAAKALKGKKATKVTIGKNVKTIKKNAFKGSKAKTVVVKTKKLTKKSVKGSLKGSKVKTVKVDVGKTKVDKKYVKKYKKIFTKKNAGKKVTVKR